MKYVLDTEFIEDGHTIDLISIGLAAKDGRTYYAISTEFDPSKASDWVKNHVLPHLHARGDTITLIGAEGEYDTPVWKSRAQIRADVIDFLSYQGSPEIWAYYGDYDWVALCQLFGMMIDLPKGFPMYCRDIKQLQDDLRILSLPVPDNPLQHHALADALWGLEALNYLQLHGSNVALRWVQDLRAQVGNYAMAMEGRLQENDHKPGWEHMEPIQISSGVIQNHMALLDAIEAGDHPAMQQHAVDIGNYAMMVFDLARKLEQGFDSRVREAG